MTIFLITIGPIILTFLWFAYLVYKEWRWQENPWRPWFEQQWRAYWAAHNSTDHDGPIQ